MKFGKPHIHDAPENDATALNMYLYQLQREASARGESLPPLIRLQIGEPNFSTPEHIRAAARNSVESEILTYGPRAGWPWLLDLLADKIRRVNGYEVDPDNIAIAVGGTGAVQVALLATVGPGDEVLVSDPCWPLYHMQLALCGATAVSYPLDPRSEWLPDI